MKILFWMYCLELNEVPVSWKKVIGGTVNQWIGYHLDVYKYQIGISERKQSWVMAWIDSKLKEGGIVGRELKSALGRLSFVAGALKHVRPFLAPIFSWSANLAPGTYAKLPDAVVILLKYVRAELERNPTRRAKRPQDEMVEAFRVDAKAAQDDIVIGGWETFHGTDTAKCRWFSVRLNRRNASWTYLRGDPYRSIASLELMGVLIALMVFGKDAKWSQGRKSVVITGMTDNAGNSHVLRKFSTSKYPLSILVMEVACWLDKLDVDLELGWVPRAQNSEADDLTNNRFEAFDKGRRLKVDFEELPFIAVKDLMAEAGRLDEELKLHRTSKEAKKTALSASRTEKPVKKRKRGELRWQDPW
eukprot:Skav229223  [mRNA]  locus=scaffold864:62799:63878:- [translate_table: standard]